jgi:hypothetical protein
LTFQAGTKVNEIYKKENKAIKDKEKKAKDTSVSKKSKNNGDRKSSKIGLGERKSGDKSLKKKQVEEALA